jgi:hypothetical protein
VKLHVIANAGGAASSSPALHSISSPALVVHAGKKIARTGVFGEPGLMLVPSKEVAWETFFNLETGPRNNIP